MLEINNITKSFGDKLVIGGFTGGLSGGLSASFGAGIHGVSAPSGSGKTTLLRIIAGLETADSGTISGAGKISFAFQEPRLLMWLSAEKNAAIAEKSTGLGAKILCELGLESELHTTPSQLSGGMQQRVSLARALAANFDTLLLDEPFTGLDEKNASAALETVKRYSSGKCVLLVTHSGDILSRLDSVCTL